MSDLRRMVSPPAGPGALHLQRKLNDLVAAAQVDPAAGSDLKDLRSLTAYALSLGAVQHLHDADPCVRLRFESHVAKRLAIWSLDSGERRGASRAATGKPDAFMAAALFGFAYESLVARDLDAHWREVLETSFAGMSNAKHRHDVFEMHRDLPGRHAAAYERARQRVVHGAPSLQGSARRRVPVTLVAPSVGVHNLPQMMWPRVTSFLLEKFPRQGWDRMRRRFCSLALARHIDPSLRTWATALDVLGVPTRSTNLSYWTKWLMDEPVAADFSDRMDRVVRGLQKHSDRVDYAARRAAMGGLFTLNDTDWQWACDSAGVRASGVTHRNPQFAAAFVWEALTDSDAALSPSLNPAGATAEQAAVWRRDYRERFVGAHLPALKPALEELAADLLRRHGLPGAVTWEPTFLLVAP